MRHRRLLIPLTLVLAGAAWLWRGEGERRDLTDRIGNLGTRLDRPPARPAPPTPPARRSAVERDPVDWQAVAEELASGSYLGGLLETNARLRAAIEAMSVEDLLAAMEQLKDAGLSKADLERLEQQLAMAILLQAPEMGFSRFAGRARNDWSFFLGDEFSKWVQRDKDAAVEWLRRHCAAGGFVSSRMIQRPFFDLLRSDPDTSAAILATRPPAMRLESLRSLAMRELKQSGQEEWAKVMRAELPAGDAPEAIAWPLMNWSDGDGAPMTLAEVDVYMERIHVTDEERKACIMTVARQLRTWELSAVEGEGEITDFDRMRSWVQRQDPGMLEPATLAGLREMANRGSFDEAGNLAIQFHEESADDAFLTEVLEAADDRTEPALLRSLIDRLSDPALREKHREEQAHRLK